MQATSNLTHNRISLSFACFGLACLLLAGCLVWLQVVKHDHYLRLADRIQHRSIVLTAPRGIICDRLGVPLAISTTGKSIFADPSQITDRQGTARQLAPLLGTTEAELVPLLGRDTCYVMLQRRADPGVVREIERRMRKHATRLRGIGLAPEPMRLYPRGALGCHVLGFVDSNSRGAGGVESTFERVLHGRDGRVVAEIDARGRIIPGRRVEERQPVPGRPVTLTIDARIQEAAEQALAHAMQETKAAGGTVLVADPGSGEILALANWPAYDPNHYAQFPTAYWNNNAVTCPYEPGSTFKLVTAIAALEEGVVRPGQIAVNCQGAKPVGRRTVHCHDGRHHGALDLRGIIIESCNIGAATLGLRLGRQRLEKYVRQLGFGARSGLELGGETAGYVAPLPEWKDITVANVAFGQGVSVTPVQLLAAYCAVANGGVLPRLHLVARVGSGEQARANAPLGRRVMSPGTAALLRQYLEDVVTEGTGSRAVVPGYVAAGKTGTAQKAPYGSGRHVGSFVGFVPADKPRLAILAMIDEPKGDYYGGLVAAPVFAEVAKLSLAQLSVPPAPVARRPR